MPAVTVLIPAYNASLWVDEAIRSALGQSFKDLEVLVVDDGSTDDTAAKVRAHGGPVRLLTVEHRGLAATRNRGMRVAGGRFIVFLDADDLLEETHVARAVDLLERQPGLAFAFCNVRSFDGSGRRSAPIIPAAAFGGRPEAVVENPLVDVLGAGWSISSSGVCATRERLDEAGFFDETLWGSEDFEYWSRLYLRRPAGYLADPLASIRRHSGNMTRRADRMIHAMAASGSKVLATCRSLGRADLVAPLARLQRRYMTGAARDILVSGDAATARRVLWQYRRELFGRNWIVLTAASCCPAPLLRVLIRLAKRVMRRGEAPGP